MVDFSDMLNKANSILRPITVKAKRGRKPKAEKPEKIKKLKSQKNTRSKALRDLDGKIIPDYDKLPVYPKCLKCRMDCKQHMISKKMKVLVCNYSPITPRKNSHNEPEEE